MKRRNFHRTERPLVMIIPMIDIMLFLLVFFMLGTVYQVQTNNFAVNLPQTSTEQKETRPAKVTLTITEHGELLYENEKITVLELPAKLKQTLAEDNDTIFLIYGDRSIKYERVVGVLELLKLNGAHHISIATELKN